MKIVLFCHSLWSDWNHGNAHFLRGLVTELCERGHAVRVYEPEDAWSVQNLIAERGELPTGEVLERYPRLDIVRYSTLALDLQAATQDADLVIVHEWNDASIVSELAALRKRGARFKLLFHDTHHRSVTDPATFAAMDLSGYDGVLAFGEAVRQRYLDAGWADRVWVFHEAADTRVFRPLPGVGRESDVVFIGNWGDDERTNELQEFLFGPVASLGLSGSVYGVRYPENGLRAVKEAGLDYRGWLPNYRVPEVFARHRVTVHVPRRPYARALPGIPTIRPFEALACGIPLVSAPWSDSEGLFRDGDIWFVDTGDQARQALRTLLNDPSAATELARRGRETVLARHTCAHRADALLEIAGTLGIRDSARTNTSSERGSTEVHAWD